MSGDVSSGSADLSSPPKVFKFHNISKDRILGGKKIKKDVSKQKLHLKILASSLEDSREKERTNIILQKYIPIKQKSVETKSADFVETKTCHSHIAIAQSEKASISVETDLKNSHTKSGGLRLKNISTLLQEPRKSIHIPDVVNVNHSHHQEAPLDLSKRGNRTAQVGGPRKPLDLSAKPKHDVRVAPAPKHQNLTNSEFIQTNNLNLNGSNNKEPSSQTQNPIRPIKFVMVDKKCILRPLNPQSYDAQTCTQLKRDGPLSFSLLDNGHTNHADEKIAPESSSSQITTPIPNKEIQAPIQMLFLNGQLARVLPSSDSSKNLSKCNQVKDNKKHEKTKTIYGGSHNISKESESMIKTNETVTKNGDLFCTFKNVKQIRLIREQQVRRGRNKKK